jgi:GntR family transcriptional regulator
MSRARPADLAELPAAIAPLGVTAANRAPLYHQIFLVLQSQIHNGDYAPGEYLPSERELSDRFGVSRITTMRAMNELAASGMVVREQGRGTRVRFVGAGVVTRGPALASELAMRTVANGQEAKPPGIVVYEFDYVAAPARVAATLQLPRGQSVQRAVRTLAFGGAPFSQLTTFVPEAIGRRWQRADLARSSVHALLARVGCHPTRLEERVSATLADALLAERLGTTVGAPLIQITRTSFAADGRALEHVQGVFRPDRYQYAVSLNDAGELREWR